MLIGLISDTHIPDRNIKLPESVKNAFKDVELVLHAGDITDESVIKKLEEIAPTIAVAGNMDRLSNSNLPKAQIIDVDLVKKGKVLKIGLIHGEVYPRGDTQQLYYTARELGVDILVSGHSHVPQLETINNIILINPGSPTSPRLSDPSVALLEINTNNKANKINGESNEENNKNNGENDEKNEEEEDIKIEFIKTGAPVCSALNYFTKKKKRR